ncbi:MAG: arsenate reductase ArsC [Alphaproteobacteria bacterium]|jgi:protein-tyrosine-phosphatase|nr:arsenate reductase ArsC [Alphaproteobacteria bacterium]MDZ4867166.1 arsenate reductase ArsC [Alphaproteobacteria bacterium]
MAVHGPNGEELPDAILFSCSMNAIRSPMAAALMKHLFGTHIYVESCGVKAGVLDPLAVEVMDEIGIDLAHLHPKSFETLADTSFDLIITLSPQARHKALELTRTMAVEVEYWKVPDPSAYDGSREQRLAAYREARDTILRFIKERFAARPAPEP